MPWPGPSLQPGFWAGPRPLAFPPGSGSRAGECRSLQRLSFGRVGSVRTWFFTTVALGVQPEGLGNDCV